ncbi:uncharacterized protein SPAPADRAFT_66724 [Spathaspora passalidarum NRRL Y-27907]|uniref:Uncharacterized protein n=1 Tax=Spathaspora passalidarum (strain NRRL Y-27907 / 11-Y1) TaxID=619300 RepID=G3AP27_SPAPN|nr:uncharacterized protein SPAPADRAFT_66724 [Spathaspora passalidarum NRRL Y-27907]EGW32058.1 hypothetical protein SPAPADRAFT_66724 [Spathaspora passalidarum NRRL Y-27907]
MSSDQNQYFEINKNLVEQFMEFIINSGRETKSNIKSSVYKNCESIIKDFSSLKRYKSQNSDRIEHWEISYNKFRITEPELFNALCEYQTFDRAPKQKMEGIIYTGEDLKVYVEILKKILDKIILKKIQGSGYEEEKDIFNTMRNVVKTDSKNFPHIRLENAIRKVDAKARDFLSSSSLDDAFVKMRSLRSTGPDPAYNFIIKFNDFFEYILMLNWMIQTKLVHVAANVLLPTYELHLQQIEDGKVPTAYMKPNEFAETVMRQSEFINLTSRGRPLNINLLQAGKSLSTKPIVNGLNNLDRSDKNATGKKKRNRNMKYLSNVKGDK